MGEELQKQLRKRLENLLKLPENQICADCSKRGPRWASVNKGVFFCIDCSGIHRNLGVHISFVRSVNLDTWKVEQVEYMEQWGNKRANELYEANLPPNVYKPKDGDSVKVVEKFIRDKYEHQRYKAKNDPPRVERNIDNDNSNDHRDRNTKVSDRNEPVTRQRPTTKSIAKTPAPAPAAAPLIDFMDMSAPPELVVAQPPPPVPTAIVDNSFDSFQNFESSSNFVASLSTPPPNQPQQKQQASADAILSLYNLPGMNAMNNQMGMGMGQQMMPMGQQMMGGIPFGGAQMQAQMPRPPMQGMPMQGMPMQGLPMQPSQYPNTQQQQQMGGQQMMGGLPYGGSQMPRPVMQGMPMQGMQQGMPMQGMQQGMPMQGMQGMPMQGMQQGMPMQGMQGMPMQGMQGMPMQGMQGMPMQGMQQGMPMQGMQGMPMQGMQQGMQGMPMQGMPGMPMQTPQYPNMQQQQSQAFNFLSL